MTKAHRTRTKIPFIHARFPGENLSLYNVQGRLEQFLTNFRIAKDKELSDGDHDDNGIVKKDVLSYKELDMIERRAKRYIDAFNTSSGLAHLKPELRHNLDVLRGGADVVAIRSENEADEIAARLHSEFPWMSAATTVIWNALRRSAYNHDDGIRLPPMLLVGPPGVGKTAWSRRLGELLNIPTLVYDATQNNASFGLVGSQRGWGNATPGQLINHILSQRIANPCVIIDEIEKAGDARSTSGQSFSLISSLLPFLEPATAASWRCPFYEVSFDMSHVSWILLANDATSLPQPLLSRCTVIHLSDLTNDQILTFARKQCEEMGLSKPAMEATMIALMRVLHERRRLDLRDVLRVVERAKALEERPPLNWDVRIPGLADKVQPSRKNGDRGG